MDIMPGSYIPGDPRLIDQIVYELKSQGIFDQFRKECIADVDTKPAYQNLSQRVEGSVMSFLRKQKFTETLNKNQLREQLRKNITESGFLESGVERIVDQVVNPKITSVFLPKVEDVVYRFLGITRPTPEEKPADPEVKIENLLPNDLEAVSPGSVHEQSTEDLKDISLNSSGVKTEDESPAFEPLEESTKLSFHEDSVDSRSTATITDREFAHNNEVNLQIEKSQDVSQNSINSDYSASNLASEDDTKMEICENVSSSEESNKPHDQELSNNSTESKLNAESDQAKEKESSNTDKKKDEGNRSKEHRSHDRHKSSKSDKKRDEKDKRDYKSDSKTRDSKEKSSSKHSSSSSSRDKKDSTSAKDDGKSKDSKTNRSREHRDRSKERSERRDKDKPKEHSKSRRDSHKDDKHSKDKASSSSIKKDSNRSKDEKSKSSSTSSDKHRSRHDSYTKSGTKERRSRSRERERKHSKSDQDKSSHSSKARKDKKESDDHYSFKEKNINRRSTDRDSNDGSSRSGKNENQPETTEVAKKEGSKDSSETFSSGGGESSNSDNVEQNIEAAKDSLLIKYIKPKLASNMKEAMKIMKIRKQLAKLERQNQRAFADVALGTEVGLQLSNIKQENSEALKSQDISMENFEALEARLAQEMSKVDKNEYGDEDDDYSSSPVKSETDKTEHSGDPDINSFQTAEVEQRIETNEEFHLNNEDTSQTSEDELFKVAVRNKEKVNSCERWTDTISVIKFNGNKEHVWDMSIFNKSEVAPCHYLANSISQKQLMLLNHLIERIETSYKNPIKQSLKRKSDDSSENNNIYFKSAKKIHMDDDDDLLAAESRNNYFLKNNVSSPSDLSVLLSPPESEKSGDTKKEQTPVKKKRAPRDPINQRYSNEDLYKPRPTLTGSRRRTGRKM